LGKLEELIEKIQEWGIHEVYFLDSRKELKIPKLIHILLKNMGIIYGKK
jgi:hypothetical protein